MILDVVHRTAYDYENRAAFSQHLLRLAPRDAPGQRVLRSEIAIEPEADSLAAHTDMFGNKVHVATLSHPHEALEIVSSCRIERTTPTALIFEASGRWEDIRAAAIGDPGVTAAPETAIYAFPSAMTGADREIENYAFEMFTPNRPVLAAAAELNSRIHREFKYLPGATSADTLPTESFDLKEGVCQDFAHVMIAIMRSLRLPVRYVSGYLRTIPPPGKERLEGADASHAWVSVWEPVFGWVDFDPTNDMVPGTDHVTLAWGRDYTDVSPVSGLVVGAGRQQLDVAVDVVPAV